jgi:hypothetical protein
VGRERIEDQRPRVRQHRVGAAEGEQRADAMPLTDVAGDLEREIDRRAHDRGAQPRHRRDDVANDAIAVHPLS